MLDLIQWDANQLKNAINASAMNLHILNLVEDMEEMDYADEASDLFDDWLAVGVPDGAGLIDCIGYFGRDKDFKELEKDYNNLLDDYDLSKDYSAEQTQILEIIGTQI